MKVKLDNSKWTQVVRGLIIGLFTGIVVSTFRLLIQYGLVIVQKCYQWLHTAPQYLPVWILGSLLLAYGLGKLITHNPAIKGSGIPQVEGQLGGSYHAKWWPVLWQKFIGGVLSIGSGLFLGREGPSIQLGAAVGQGFSSFKRDDIVHTRVSIATGAAAGLSAAFNAPIASTMFILEEVYHNFSPLIWLSALVSAMMSNFVSLTFFGLTPVLHIAYTQTLPLQQYGYLILLGIVLGLLGRLYQITLLNLPKMYGVLHRVPQSLYPIVPFLLVIPIGWYFPQILGGGNGIIVTLAGIRLSVTMLAGLLLLRFVFSMISYGSGLPGGIFLPILTIGAVIGGLFAQSLVVLHLLAPQFVANFIIYAMAGYFAGIGKAPFTAILLITEMVGSLGHLMPLALVSIVAYLVVDQLNGAPIYEALLNKMIQRQPVITHDKLDVLSVPIFADSELDGIQIRDYSWPKNMLVYAIERGDKQLLPHGDTILQAGDTLMISLPQERAKQIMKQIRQAASANNSVTKD